MADIDPDFPMDRVLTDETRKRIMRGYRQLLSAPDSNHEDVEITEELPFGVDVILLERFEDNTIHAQVLLDHGDGPTLVTDDVEDCPHHIDGDQLSTMADFGEDYADLEKDLMEVSALMCDLPEYNEEFQRYVHRAAFENLYCIDGLLKFTFAFGVADVIVQAYQDFKHELGERLRIPIEPSLNEGRKRSSKFRWSTNASL